MNNVFADLARPLVNRPGMVIVEADDEVRAARRQRAVRKLNHLPKIPNPWDLTPAQCAVLQLIVDGCTNEQTAAKLGIALKTVDAHLYNVYERMAIVEQVQVSRPRAAVLWDRHVQGRAAE